MSMFVCLVAAADGEGEGLSDSIGFAFIVGEGGCSELGDRWPPPHWLMKESTVPHSCQRCVHVRLMATRTCERCCAFHNHRLGARTYHENEACCVTSAVTKHLARVSKDVLALFHVEL